MITAEAFWRVVALLGAQATDDIEWSEAVGPPSSPEEFAKEAIFVICNSGMQNKVARAIFERCVLALGNGSDITLAFRHKGKTGAISFIWRERQRLFAEFRTAPDQLAYIESLPWIGSITKFHLAKNFGMNFAKPDVHLQRLADQENCTVQALCDRLARETGLRAATVDTVLWRACANGVIHSRSGHITSDLNE